MECCRYPLISVGIPTFNRADLLKRAIDSVLNQDYPNIEIVVSDNCSEDGTETLMKEYKGFENVKYFRNEKNLGAIGNYKSLSRKMNGEYVFLLPDDDYLIDSCFFRDAIKLMEKCPNVILVHGIVQDYFYEKKEIIFTNPKYTFREVRNGIDYLKYYCEDNYEVIRGLFALIKKEIFDDVGGLDDSPFLDTTLYFKLFLKGDVGFINRLIGGMQMRTLPYKTNAFLDLKTVKYNMNFLEEISLEMFRNNICTEKELKEWKIRWQINFIMGYSYDFKDDNIKSTIIYLDETYPETLKRMKIIECKKKKFFQLFILVVKFLGFKEIFKKIERKIQSILD